MVIVLNKLYCAEELVGSFVVAKTNTLFVASMWIISEYEVLCYVKHKHKVGAIELVSSLAHTDLL